MSPSSDSLAEGDDSESVVPPERGVSSTDQTHQCQGLIKIGKITSNGFSAFNLTCFLFSLSVIVGGVGAAMFVVGNVVPDPCPTYMRPSPQTSPTVLSPSYYENLATPNVARKVYEMDADDPEGVTITVVKSNISTSSNINEDKINYSVENRVITEEELESEIRRLAIERERNNVRRGNAVTTRRRRIVGERKTLATFALRGMKEDSRSR